MPEVQDPKEETTNVEKPPLTEPSKVKPNATPPEPKDEKPDKPDDVTLPIAEQKKQLAEMNKLVEAQKKEIEGLSEFKKKMKDVFSDDAPKEEKKKDTISSLKEVFMGEFKKINERLDAKEQEETMQGISDSLGLKTPEEKEFLEFKMAKLQEDKGENIQAKDIQDLGASIKKMFGKNSKKDEASSVSETDPGPARNIGNADSITFKQFQGMDIMERSEFFRINPKLCDKFFEQEKLEEVQLG